MTSSPEHRRLLEHHQRHSNWKKWGPYLSDRAWGTVREDYSETGNAWNYFPHDHARMRAYRWNEDGIGGISDRHQYVCFAVALWNGKDPIIKERFFGLNPQEGNHGEDVKEYYFYLDNTPTHSYMKMLYKYPHQAYPYEQLIQENQRRSSRDPEYELIDTGIFQEKRYFDVQIEYAKAGHEDILIRLSITNQASEAAPLYLLPTVWFRNTWSWGYPEGPMEDVPTKPFLFQEQEDNRSFIKIEHPALRTYYLYAQDNPDWIFTENDTNFECLMGKPNPTPYVKDAFDRYLVHQDKTAVNPAKKGSKGAALYKSILPAKHTEIFHLRLCKNYLKHPFEGFNEIFSLRKHEADLFYEQVQNQALDKDAKNLQRQAFAGLLWSKQLYYYDIEQWLRGDKQIPLERQNDRNQGWIHLVNFDVISMPDKWEYPWYASWDLGFHCISLVLIDPDFAKRQLILMTREWYMHPNGQLPAYEWNFSDVNPPVLAWAAWRIYKIDGKQTGKPDRNFLEAIFHKLLLNFTWWVNQKDEKGNNVFQGGFLGLDNISIFDRSSPLNDARIDQADGTAWMSFYCILMMKISIELARTNPVYQDSATKFFEHFLRIASAMIKPEQKGYSLWCNEDGFFYDALHTSNDVIPLRIRSLVGLLPILAVETIDRRILDALPIYKQRLEWFLKERPDYTSTLASVEETSTGARHLLSILDKERLVQTLSYLFDENEFLSEYGIRSLSKYHEKHPYSLKIWNQEHFISYHPGEAEFRLIAGGNSNWRGPIWFPINYLLIESLQKFYHYYGDSLKVEFPTGSGNLMNLGEISKQLSNRLISLFLKRADGTRPIYPKNSPFNHEEDWQNLFLFFEFFHGDTGEGHGASHQTGWTALIAKLLQQC